MNHTFELPGLREDNPRDFLAALGLLRLMDTIWPETHAKLSWNSQTGTPSTTSTHPLAADFPQQLWDLLRDIKDLDNSPLEPVTVEAVSPADHRKKIIQAVERKSKIEVMILVAVASQLEMEKASRRSDFIIESGQRRVMKGVCDMLAEEFFGPALLDEIEGRATPVKVSNSSRWNPAEFRSAAYTTSDPAKTDFLDFPGLNVIAFIGLTFYPVVDSSKNKATPGFTRSPGNNHFSWPVWSEPLLPDEITSVLHHSEVHAIELNHSVLSKIGIDRVWRTRKFGDANNKYFSTAMPI
ncbi:MAG: hypothetical protein EAZ42_05670 [Verrucomicrobia bacterium]|nr:MAG: hypothetical protein EAZ42_05670 [Verrucomicrobiota bacterium]